MMSLLVIRGIFYLVQSKIRKIIHWLRRQLKLEGIKPLDVLLTSGKKNYHLDELMQMIDQYRKGRMFML